MTPPTVQPNRIAAEPIPDERQQPNLGRGHQDRQWSEEQPWPDEAELLCGEPEDFEDELGLPEDEQERAGRVVRRALRACPDLTQRSSARDDLWMSVQDEICTCAPKFVRPFGSSKPYCVTQEHATDELITAMTWLTSHEAEARKLAPLDLFVRLRGVATKSGGGSARAVQADSLCGITEVPPGQILVREPLREVDAA
jgi:hypothetical protein